MKLFQGGLSLVGKLPKLQIIQGAILGCVPLAQLVAWSVIFWALNLRNLRTSYPDMTIQKKMSTRAHLCPDMDLFSLIKTPVLDTLFYRLSHLFACLCEYMFNYINQRSQISGSHIKFSLFNLGAACFGFALQLGIPSKSENQN